MLHEEFLEQINEMLSNESLMSKLEQSESFGIDNKQALLSTGFIKGMAFSAQLLKEKGFIIASDALARELEEHKNDLYDLKKEKDGEVILSKENIKDYIEGERKQKQEKNPRISDLLNAFLELEEDSKTDNLGESGVDLAKAILFGITTSISVMDVLKEKKGYNILSEFFEELVRDDEE